MKKILIIITFSLINLFAFSQEKFFTRTGEISFHSDAPLEKIEAHNRQATSILNTKNGEIAFSVLMKGFEFEKALMQEHFNENYVESDKFPKSTFSGNISNFSEINLTSGKNYDVKVTGELTIHGVTKSVVTNAKLKPSADQIFAEAEFSIVLKDYNIKIPKSVIDNISEEVKIKIKVELKPYNN